MSMNSEEQHLKERYIKMIRWGNQKDIYRVSIHRNRTGGRVHHVHVTMVGANLASTADPEIEGTYSGVNALPEWMQEKLAVLSMLRLPTNDPEEAIVEGVGRKIGEHLYWVER